MGVFVPIPPCSRGLPRRLSSEASDARKVGPLKTVENRRPPSAGLGGRGVPAARMPSILL